MAQYFTFDGTKFHNKDAFKSIEVGSKEITINTSIYLQVLVQDQDGAIIYKSNDYKISEGNHNTTNGFDNFSKHMDYVISCIANI